MHNKFKLSLIGIVIIIAAGLVYLLRWPPGPQCKDGKFVEIGNRLQCVQEEVACKTVDDCVQGFKDGVLCFNKKFQSWYEESVRMTLWDPNFTVDVSCECRGNVCKEKYTRKR